MLGFLQQPHKLPPISAFPLSDYCNDFSLDRLVLGVDNIRHDVLLSPTFVSATRKIVSQLIARHTSLGKKETGRQQPSWAKEVNSYTQLYKEVMRDALNKAKGRSEIQVVYLARTAVIKMLLEEIRNQYEQYIGRLKKSVRHSDLVLHNDLAEAPKLKGKLQDALQRKEEIQKQVGLEMCSFWMEVEKEEIKTMHEAVFGNRAPFFEDLLDNPLMHVDQYDNEFLTIAEYDVALGRRIEDPDKYETLLFFIRRILNYIDLRDPASDGVPMEKRLRIPSLTEEKLEGEERKAYNKKIVGWIQAPGNMDLLFNWQLTKLSYQELKRQKGDREEQATLRTRIRYQKRLLQFFYAQFRKYGLMDRVTAAYEMQPEYLEYCPPLTPHQIIQYLHLPKTRKVVHNRLKRMKKVSGRIFSLKPLRKKIKAMEQMSSGKRKAYLVRFMNAFARYHRDRNNAEMAHDAMERVHIANEEKVVTLSRENNTLYEFLLPHEQAGEKAPIINHAVIKADVRGSTDITYQMNARNLNPASYFSLNFFDPISEILSDYDASKVFIEGDAIILSIFERENTPGDWYGVARACGIALNMLIIIQRYNEKSKRYQLPILELGIGISFLKKPPTFLFDGNNRIMISTAINQADRLSSCSKTGRRLLSQKRSPFNLYVFQTLSDEDMAATADDLYTRYNVNGIELSSEGFEKLSKEIDLKLLQGDFTDKNDQKSNLYTGKFPTKSGRYQRLIIREAQIPVVDPATFKTLRISSRKYYEVCTHPKLYKLARQKY